MSRSDEMNNDSAPWGDALSLMSISDSEFLRIQNLVHTYFGISLSDEKKTLVVGRLQRFLKNEQFESFDDYMNYVEKDSSGTALSSLIDHISTNHTFFFREKEHFEFIENQVFPDIEARLNSEKTRDIRIWSAGCSGGDEAYSLVITLMEYFKKRYLSLDAGLLATDISEKMLDEAKEGIYSDKRILFVPDELKQKYFTSADENRYLIKDLLKREVTFRRFNLTNTQFPFKKPFDVIMCRNVMIYFSREIRKKLVSNLYDHTRPGGYLFVGHSESLNEKSFPYTYVKPGIYQKGTSE